MLRAELRRNSNTLDKSSQRLITLRPRCEFAVKLIIGGYGTGNVGDEAILRGLIMRSCWDRGDALVFSRSPNQTMRQHGVRAKRKNLLDFLRAQEVIVGGGELFQDNMAWKHSLAVLGATILAKKAEIVAVGVPLIRSRVERLLTRIAFSVADRVSVRDEHSKARLIELGVSRPVAVRDDPSVYVTPAPSHVIREILSREEISAGCSPLMGLALRLTDREVYNNRILEFFPRFLESFLSEHRDSKVVFLPFCRDSDSTLERDEIVGEALRERVAVDRFHVLKGLYAPDEMMGIMRVFDIVISMRLHPLIFASLIRVPAIALCWYEKVRTFAVSRGQACIELDDLHKLPACVEAVLGQQKGSRGASRSAADRYGVKLGESGIYGTLT